MTLHKRTFDWDALKGSAEVKKWAMRDLTSIDAVLALTLGRTCCVQAGGNVGCFAKYLARFFGSVITFEPAPELFPLLTANTPEPNIIRLQAALGAVPDLVGMACSRRGKKDTPAHEGLTHVAGPGIVPMVRLDDFMLPIVDLLYLDLEGFELEALRGASATLVRCRPVVSVEINQNIGFYGKERQDVRDFLTQHGYAFARRIQSDEVFLPC